MTPTGTASRRGTRGADLATAKEESAAREALRHFGWSDWFEARRDPAVPLTRVGRVTSVLGRSCNLESGSGATTAESGMSLRRGAASATALPAVGDWIEVSAEDPPRVARVLPRRTALTRKIAGEVTEGQVMAANVDLVLVVASLGAELRPRGLERYLTIAWESGAEPIVVLTKADLSADLEAVASAVREVALNAEVRCVSSLTGEGMAELEARLSPGLAAVVVGPSGAGKSTLLNYLLGSDELATGAVRGDTRGRHTTTHREMFQLPGGALVIDTPGLRELQLWYADDGLAMAFRDLDELARDCRFSDCGHRDEPGCRVREAVAAGTLAEARVESYLALQGELAALALRGEGRVKARQQAESRRVAARRLRGEPARDDSES
ncbi:MAG: ribosome small subunit-dependent GTPase A [Candidatus Dormibacteria bacterium]